MKQQRKDSTIAAIVTFAAALIILLWLFFGGMRFDRSELAAQSVPEIQPDEEELFLEPELMADLGEPDAVAHDEPAPAFKGEPQQSAEENTKLVVPGKSEARQTPPVEKPATQTKPSEVKATEPPKTDEDKKKVTSAMANKFSTQNGSESGSSGTAGAGGNGVGIAGSITGRTFMGCPKPSVKLQSKVVVEVRVTIDAAGKVIKATPRSKSGNASKDILNACQKAAMQARWSEDKDTPSASGTLTFTITPR